MSVVNFRNVRNFIIFVIVVINIEEVMAGFVLVCISFRGIRMLDNFV